MYIILKNLKLKFWDHQFTTTSYVKLVYCVEIGSFETLIVIQKILLNLPTNSTNLEEDNDSFQDGGGLTMKSKKIARRSLLRLRCAFYVEKKYFFLSTETFFSMLHFFPSALVETPKKLGKSSRRNSLSTLSMPSKLFERQLMSLNEGECSSRPFLRKDLPVCWLDMEQNIKENISNLNFVQVYLYNFVY